MIIQCPVPRNAYSDQPHSIAPAQLDFKQFLSFMAGASFVVCAHGGGYDPAPKAFEALAAGSIPIITSSALDSA